MELEAQNSSLEVLLKEANERNMDIAPLREHALLLRGKIYQVHVKLAEEVFKESRGSTVGDLSNSYRTQGKDLEIAETIQGQLT